MNFLCYSVVKSTEMKIQQYTYEKNKSTESSKERWPSSIMIAELFSSIIDVSWTTSDLIEQVNIPQILAGEHKFASNLKDVEQNRIV